jgi:hypothetical protein
MTDPLPDPVPDPPELDPSTLAGANFSRVRKGFEPSEVHSLLGRTADALRTWQERDDRTQERIEELERRLSASEELDEQRITTVLGEETARIVAAAREAAAEIRTKAEEQSARLVRESEESAAEAAAAVTAEAAAQRDEATRARDEALAESTRLREEALAESTRLRDEAAATATLLRDDAVAEAERVRDEALAESTRLREDAQLSHDEMLERASSVLEERTTEAESVAAGIREAAEAELSTARVEAERIRAEAKDAAAAEIDRARGEGRDMVAEARRLRERMLRDLAERRRTARRQIEAARAGRDSIVESLRGVGAAVDSSIAAVAQVDEDAKRAADAAAAAVDDDIDSVVAEFETGLTMGGLESSGPPDVEGVGTVVDVPVDDGDAGQDDVDERSPGATVHDLFERIRAERSEGDDGRGGDVPRGGIDAGRTTPAESGAAAVAAPADPIEEREELPESDVVIDVEAIEVEVTEVAKVAVVAPEVRPDGAAGTDDDADSPPAVSVLDRRDELLAAPEKALARTLKRLVSDEQNEVLDRLRRTKRGRPELAALLPEGPDVERFTEALAPEFRVSAEAGSIFWSERSDRAPATAVDDERLETSLTRRVTELLGIRRAHVQRVLDDADAAGLELAELGDHVRAAYREWRAQSASELAGDLATAGFAEGLRAAAGVGTPWCWVPDNGGLPCSDAEDNSLAGEVPCGDEFPTGDVIPPAHSGCRCILVPGHR